MKKIFLIFLLVGATLNSFSQKKQTKYTAVDDFGRIVNPLVVEGFDNS